MGSSGVASGLEPSWFFQSVNRAQMGAYASSPGPCVRDASGWSCWPLCLRHLSLTSDLALVLILFLPLNSSSHCLLYLPPQLTFTKPHCGWAAVAPTGMGRLWEGITPGPRALPAFQGKLACSPVPRQLLWQALSQAWEVCGLCTLLT